MGINVSAEKDMINTMMAFFKASDELYGVCPCCDDVFRMSEVRIFSGKKPPKDWLSDFKKRSQELEKRMREFEQEKKKISKKAIEQSASTRVGQLLEKFAHYIPQVEHNPVDMVPIFQPIDYISFDGWADNKEVSEISFIEIKTGKSRLTDIQKSIRDAVDDKRVIWKDYNLSKIVDETSLNDDDQPEYQEINLGDVIREIRKEGKKA